MNLEIRARILSTYFLISIFSLGLLMSYVSANNSLLTRAWAANPYQISNDQVKDTYLMYIKQKINQGLGPDNTECQPGLGLGKLKSDDLLNDNILCNPGLENMKNKYTNGNLDDKIVNRLSENIDKKNTILKDKLEKLRERMERVISEEKGQKPIPKDEQNKVNEEDKKTEEEHKSVSGDNCRDGNVLDGASNEGDLKVVAECQDATGDVMHTKKMNDGDYKFLVKLEDKYKFLINDKNDEKTDGLLIVEVVPKDQDIKNVDLPKEGDKVHIWGAWVTDKPKGWHEIHPTWEVTKE
jgi:hypothetical protein